MPGVPRDSALGKQRLAAAAKRGKTKLATPSSMVKAFAKRHRGETGPAGLTASQRATLKQTPAEKKARMASAQERMGMPVKHFARRHRASTGAGAAVSSLSRPLKRKATRTTSRSPSRR